MAKKDCVFCKIVNGEIPVEKIYKNKNFIAFPDANPQTDGHTLIVSKKHFADVMEMPQELGGDLIDAVKKIAELRMKNGAEGFNLITNCGKVAGQIVMHLHFHFLPRKSGDEVKIIG